MTHLLYSGFDGLDVSFQAQIRDELCVALETAKQRAQDRHEWAPFHWNGVEMLVSESGARGGYAFIVSTGEFGATWFFKKPNARDPWGVRVSCNSFNLAINGLGRARSDIYRTLDLLGVAVFAGQESIGRVDYALDFLSPGLVLRPEHFVMHSSTHRTDQIENTPMIASGKSGRVTSVTIGKMPGRQMIVYDKRAEVIQKRKVGWWEIWDAARAREGRPPLVRENAALSRVWRVEARAGKKHLKDDWAIRSWSDLDARLGDMITAMFKAVRHTEPASDRNRGRWRDSALWREALKQCEVDLFELRNWAAPDLVKRVQLAAHDELLAMQMTGLLTTRAALRDLSFAQLLEFARTTGSEMINIIARSRSRYERKLLEAILRYELG